jgi:hypothetical protein
LKDRNPRIKLLKHKNAKFLKRWDLGIQDPEEGSTKCGRFNLQSARFVSISIPNIT